MIYAAIAPVPGFSRTIAVPASKSHTNRALILAALAPGEFFIRGLLDCGDADALIASLRAAGARLEKGPGGCRVVPAGSAPREEIVFDVRDSGTAFRFLTAFAATRGGLRATLTGSERLCRRPIGPLVEALRRLGACIEYRGHEGFAPLRIVGRELAGGTIEIEATESSQFASALLLAAPRFPEGITVQLLGEPVSRAYLSTTVETLRAVGIGVSEKGNEFSIGPGAKISRPEYSVPGDYSSAVSLAAAAAVAGGELTLTNLLWPSEQADARAISVLEAMGASVEPIPEGLRIRGRASHPLTVVATDFPDAVPVLCAVAARLGGDSSFAGVAHLRFKESDRIAAIRDMLGAAGVEAGEQDGTLRVHGQGSVRAGLPVFPTHGDHRMVMAGTVLALSSGGLVENPGAVSKSYPRFFDDLLF